MFLNRRFIALSIILLLVISAPGTVFAGGEPPVDESKYEPKVMLSSESTVSVTEGQTKEITIEVKNVGTGRAEMFFAQVVPGAEDPFTASVSRVGGSDTIQAGAYKQLRLTIAVDKGAQEKVYPIKLSFSYINQFRKTFEREDTINIKINNPLSAEKIRLYDFALEPSSLKAGETGVLSFTYMNMGSADERNVRFALEGLETDKITVPDGLSAQEIPLIRPYVVEHASFTIRASENCKNGSYPIIIKVIVRNSAGEAAENTYEYYVNVGGGSDVGDASFDVLNISSPGGTYGVGESFSVSFELKNTSAFDADNLLIRANAVEGAVIVPVSQSMFMERTFPAGEAKTFTFTFAATSAAKSQNYPISFDIEYDAQTSQSLEGDQKIRFSQFFGVNIFNPEQEDEGDSANKNIPKIIVSSYQSDPVIVKAGGEFDLNMSFMNTHSEKIVKNIRVSLTVTDKDENIGASIFSPVNASNTLYIGQIEPGQTASRSIRYYTVPNANAQTYSINVGFQYEDAEGTEINSQEIVGINVSQPPSVETSEIVVPEITDVGVPVFVSFEVYNTGNAAVNNLKAVLEGDMETDSGKTIWVGNFEKGSSEYIECSFYYYEPGQQSGKIILSYDSVTGEHFELPTEFSIMVNEPMPMDPGMLPPEMPPENSFPGGAQSNTLIIAAAVAVAAICGGAGFWYYKKKKKQSEEDFYE